jgi:hypothetical protein
MSPRGNQQLRLMSPQPAGSSFRFLVVWSVCLTESPDDRDLAVLGQEFSGNI